MHRQVPVGGHLSELKRELVPAFVLGEIAEQGDLRRVGQCVGKRRKKGCCGRRG